MVPLGVAVGAVLAAAALLYFLSLRLSEDRNRPSDARAKPWPCPVCGNELRLHAKAFTPLLGEGAALIVQQRPEAYRRKLGDIRCTRCRTTHTFLMDTPQPQWIISDEGRAGHRGVVCTQCRRTLVNPPWPKGARDGAAHRVTDAPPQAGLVCARCGDVSCVECVRAASQGRTQDGSYICPRCYRQPIDAFHHF